MTRAEIDHYLAEGQWIKARGALCELWRKQPTASTASYMVASFARMAGHAQLLKCRLAILRSFTVEPVVPMLRAAALAAGIDLTVQVGEFNTYAQEILDPGSKLYKFQPDVVILAVQTRDIAPGLWETWADGQAAPASFGELIAAFRQQSNASLVVHNLELPAHPSHGVLDAQRDGQARAIRRFNDELQAIAAGANGVYVLDYDNLVARHGRERWHDERKWLTVRLPIRAEHLGALASEWLRFLHPLTGRTGKVLVTDLDNTLWGGVIGEEGMNGIEIGREWPGAAYYALQRVMLDLTRRGVLLAIASKNNHEDAMRALESHSGMLLRPEHFSAMRLNWNDKAASLREIAAELNVGLDSLVFIDDNPAERERIRQELPEVTVIELPEDPLGYARALRECPMFERLALSSEDAERARLYAEQRQREQLQQSANNLEEYYHSLAQKVEIAPVSEETLARTVQLINKTNQFNLTTRRYNEAEVAAMAATPGCAVYTVRVADRFGDNGLVGVCITRRSNATCEIDSFLLSCRVIGRTVETAVLAYLAAENRARGVEALEGWFLPTRKNSPAEAFYRNHGFQLAEQRDGAGLWRLPLADAAVACPPWIEIAYPKESAEYVHA